MATSISDILNKMNSSTNSTSTPQPVKPFVFKPSFEQRVANEAAKLDADIRSVRYELAQTSVVRGNRVALENDIKAALKEGQPKSRWSKNQTLAEKLDRLPNAPRKSSKMTREEKEDMGLGAYIAGQWTEWGK